MASYRHIEYGLHESVVRMQDLLARSRCVESVEYRALEEIKALISDKTYILAVMGEFKRGKSSLINALLGSPILPADVEPTTATLNRIVFSTRPYVDVRFADGTSTEVGMDQLSSYVTKEGLGGGVDAASIEEVVIGHPAPLTRNHIEIYDTPGLNDDKRMTAIAIQMVEKADMVLVPISALTPYSETEQDFVCDLIRNKRIDHIMFVVTFLDMLGEDGIDYNFNRFMHGHGGIEWRIKNLTFKQLEGEPEALARAHELLDELNVCAVSAKQALKAYATGNASLLSESRIDEFRNRLIDTLTARQTIAMGTKVRRAVESAATLAREASRARAEEACSASDALSVALARMPKLPDDIRRRVNQLLADTATEEDAVIEQLDGLEEEVVRCYVKALASLRTANASAIRAAIALGDSEREQLVDSFLEQARQRLGCALRGIVAPLMEDEATLPLEQASIPDVLLVSQNERLAGRMEEDASRALAQMGMTWHDPFGGVADYDLSKANPIASIRREASLAKGRLAQSIRDACARGRVAYLKGFVSYASGLSKWASRQGAGISHAARQRAQMALELQEQTLSTADAVTARVQELAGELAE